MWLFLLALPVFASQVHTESLTLADVVRAAEVIAVVRPLEPAVERVEIPITEPGGPWPPFVTGLQRFTVVEVVHDPRGLVSPAQELAVGGAEVESQLSLHTDYYVRGISKSPIYFTYEGPQVEGERVVMLRPCTIAGTDRLCYAAQGAWEKPAKKGEISALVAKGP